MKRLRFRLLGVFTLVSIWSAGCFPELPVPLDATRTEVPVMPSERPGDGTPTPSGTPLPTETAAPSRTGAPSPSHTGTEMPVPTETPAPTQPLLLNAVVIAEFLPVHSGPGYVYDPIAALGKGVPVNLIAVDAGLLWVLVDLGLGQSGWVFLGGLDYTGSVGDLPTALAPPTPTATLTPIPQARITRLAFNHGGDLIIFGEGFIPGESVSISVTKLATGENLGVKTYTIPGNGVINSYTYYLPNDDTGEFSLVIVGDKGSYAQQVFVVED